jgi:hypothetical protein
VSKVSPWLDNTPTPDMPTLTDAELVAVWTTNRNNMLGAMAADEGMKRHQARLKPKLENPT